MERIFESRHVRVLPSMKASESSKINVTILSKIGRSIRGRSTNRETTYMRESWPFLKLYPCTMQASNTNLKKKEKKRTGDWKWEGYVACFGSSCLFFRGGCVGIILCFRRIRNRIIGFLWWNDIWREGQKVLGNEFVSFAMLWGKMWNRMFASVFIYVLGIVGIVIN